MTQTPPFFAIVIPMYNTGRYISECILSVKKQTFRDFIAVLVDDGSTDETCALAQALIADDSRFILLKQRNQGVSSARNSALSYLKGINPNYLAFVDSDDVVVPSWLERIYESLLAQPSDIVIYGVQEFDKNGDIFVKTNVNEILKGDKNLLLDCYFGKKRFDKDTMLAHQMLCNKIYRFDCVAENEFCEKYIVGEDQKYFLDALPKLQRVLIIPEVFYRYRVRLSSLSRNGHPRDVDVLDIYISAISKCEDKNIRHYIFNEAMAHLQKLMQKSFCDNCLDRMIDDCLYRRILSLKRAGHFLKLTFKEKKRLWFLSINKKISYLYLKYRFNKIRKRSNKDRKNSVRSIAPYL